MKNLSLALGAWCMVIGAGVAFAGVPGLRLVPDYNRDGKIDEVDCERAAKGEAFAVWLNDDNKTNSDRLCDRNGTVTFQKVTKPSDAAGFFTVRVSPGQVFTVEVDYPGAIIVISPVITEEDVLRDR